MADLLLIDGNNLAIRLFLSQAVQNGSKEIVGNYDLWRYLMFTNMIGYANSDTSRIVVAIDGPGGSWRKIAFKPYKANRKAKRDASEFDWSIFFKEYSNFMLSIDKHTPIKVINIERVEGDDVIGTIASKKYSFDRNIKIVTADSDYKQLIRPHVAVYDPMKGEYMECKDTEQWLREQSLMGQQKDNIYNVLTPDDWGETPETKEKRKPGFGPVACKKVFDFGFDEWLDKNNARKLYMRNRFLIDLAMIPEQIQQAIIKEYNLKKDYDIDRVNELFEIYGWTSLTEEFGPEDNAKAHNVLKRIC
ncbi:MAG: hypothetical protein EOL93_01940 [Epsilonproteobacteria bacterium]|nr:hypothetical protein [Campylobacterota bacterium]